MRSLKAWKGILISWFVIFLLVSLIAMPMKSALSAGLGKSTVTELLKDGINAEIFADLNANYGSLGSYFFMGLLTLAIVSFVVNSFLTGGLFNSLRKNSGVFSSQEFFSISAGKFWKNIIIMIIFSLLILSLLILIVIIPVSIISVSERVSDVKIFHSVILLSSLFLLVSIIVLISADFARAWLVTAGGNSLMAVKFGFRETFRTFYTSYPIVLIMLSIQVLFMWLVLNILHGIKPDSGAGILLLFAVSQILFILKLFLKTCRYACVTVVMESGVRSEE